MRAIGIKRKDAISSTPSKAVYQYCGGIGYLWHWIQRGLLPETLAISDV